MKKLLTLMIILFFFSACSEKKEEDFTLHILHSTDVHGDLFSFDFINNCSSKGGYARIATYVQQLRSEGKELLLLDGGDILQGQPGAYYYNFMDTTATHLFASALNYLEYDALVVGNHDIETGHSVYDRWMKQLKMPLLGANVIRTAEKAENEVPYFQPYLIFQKGEKRIALIGLTTPSVVHQLPEVLWHGMRFEDQVETAKACIPEILAAEPDFIVAAIHSGIGKMDEEPDYLGENIGWDLARSIPELDLILMGHDHAESMEMYRHPDGKVTWLLNPANNAEKISHTVVHFFSDGTKEIEPQLVSLRSLKPDPNFLKTFEQEYQAVSHFVNQPVGYLLEPMDARSVLFRPAPFLDMIHQLQRSIFPEAEISISAPLADNTLLDAGKLYMRDLFNLYKYENMLYLMELTGEEVRMLLEESYDRWIRTMSDKNDPMIRMNPEKAGGQYRPTEFPTYNFDSAAGITYTIDLSKQRGERIVIKRVGKKPFRPDRKYKVAINSYRGNGGGGLLTNGAGIPYNALRSRVIKATEYDLRYYLIDFLKKHNPYRPHLTADWKFIPEEWADVAIPRDSVLLFR